MAAAGSAAAMQMSAPASEDRTVVISIFPFLRPNGAPEALLSRCDLFFLAARTAENPSSSVFPGES
jgi:hypothetical protein